MNDNLEQFKTEKKDDLKEELQSEWTKLKRIGKNQKLLDELKELIKIQNELLLLSWINLSKTVKSN
jgi:hypothetical protein